VSETIRLWDVAAKKAVDVPISGAQAGLQAGVLRPLAGGPVPVRMQTGAIMHVAPEDLGHAFADGAVFAPRAEAEASERATKYNATPGLAAGAGALKGLGAALGVPTDRVIGTAAPYIDGFKQEQDLYRGHYVSGVGERVLGASEGLAEYNPVAHGVGELGGFVVGAGLTGGGVAGALGRSGMRGMLAGGALEGAALAEVDLDNELARRGEALTAESFFVNGGVERVLAGGVLGAGASGLGHIVSSAPGALRRSIAGRLGAATEAGARGVQALDAFATPYARQLATEAEGQLGRLHGALTSDTVPASAEMAEAWAAASHAELGKNRMVVLPGEDPLKIATTERSARGYLMAQGPEAFTAINQDIAGQGYKGMDYTLNHSPKVTKETFGPQMQAHARALAPAGLTPEVEAAARQVIEDTVAPAREVLAKRAEAEVALEEAKRAVAGVAAAEKQNAQAIRRAETELATTQRKIEESVARKRLAVDQAHARLAVEEKAGSAARIASAARDVEAATAALRVLEGDAAVRLEAAQGRFQSLRAAATGVDEGTRAELMAAVADAEKGMRETAHPLMDDFLGLVDHVSNLAKAPPKTNADWHDALYEMSARYKKIAKNGASAFAQEGATQETAEAARAAAAHFTESRNAVRSMMGDEQLYGKLGAWSRDYNPLRAAQIAAEKNALSGFATRQEGVTGKSILEVDGNKMRGLFKEGIHDNTAGPNSLRRDNLQEYIDATEKIHKLIEERLPISDAARTESKAVREELARARKAMQDSATHAEIEAKMKAAGALGSASSLRSGNAAMVGGIVGGAPGAAVAGGLGALSSRGQRVAHKSLIQKIVRQVDEVLGTNVSAFFKGKGVTVGPTASALFLKGAGGARKVFERSVDAIRQAVADPAALGAKVTHALGGLGDASPGVAMHFSQILMRGVGHLAQHIPAGMDPQLDVVAPQFIKPMYSDSEMRSWARRAAAVNDPMSILRHMAAGAASQEEAEVLAEVYPELHEQIKKGLAEHLAKLPAPPTRAQRIQLSVVFGLPVDLNTTPSILLYLQTPAPGRGGGRRGNAPNGGGLKTPVLKTHEALRLETQKER
jgi:hypothetical protein